MIYVANRNPVEAFRFGSEEAVPDWCAEFLNNMCVMHGDAHSGWCEYSDPKQIFVVADGDYICKTGSGHIFVLAGRIFESLFVALPQGTVFVNMGGNDV